MNRGQAIRQQLFYMEQMMDIAPGKMSTRITPALGINRPSIFSIYPFCNINFFLSQQSSHSCKSGRLHAVESIYTVLDKGKNIINLPYSQKIPQS